MDRKCGVCGATFEQEIVRCPCCGDTVDREALKRNCDVCGRWLWGRSHAQATAVKGRLVCRECQTNRIGLHATPP